MRTFKTIRIPIPKNLPERYRRLFAKKSTYKVMEHENSFITRL